MVRSFSKRVQGGYAGKRQLSDRFRAERHKLESLLDELPEHREEWEFARKLSSAARLATQSLVRGSGRWLSRES